MFDDSYVRFSENACIIIQKGASKKSAQHQPMATRVFGAIPNELKFMGFQKITSLAKEVI
jgi:ribosomal protein L14